jgi:hypothetical protein
MTAVSQIPEEVHLANFCDALPNAIDATYPQLFHKLPPLTTVTHDWDWLKDQIRQFRKDDGDRAVLSVTPSGEFGTAMAASPNWISTQLVAARHRAKRVSSISTTVGSIIF